MQRSRVGSVVKIIVERVRYLFTGEVDMPAVRPLLTEPPTELELASIICHCEQAKADVVRRLAFQKDKYELMLQRAIRQVTANPGMLATAATPEDSLASLFCVPVDTIVHIRDTCCYE